MTNIFVQPKGDRFAIIHGENSMKPDITFYQMAGKKYELLSMTSIFLESIAPY